MNLQEDYLSKLHFVVGAGPEGVGTVAGDEGGDAGSGQGEPAGSDGGDQGGQSQDDASGAQQGAEGAKKTSSEDTDWRTHARDWEKRAKTSNKQLEQVKKLLGLTKDEDLDPKELSEKLQTSNTQYAETVRENKVLRYAPKAGVDADALLDSRRFMSAVAELDTDSASFDKDLQKLIADEVKARPSLKVVPETKPPAKSGTPVDNSTKPQLTRDDLKKMSPEDIVKAQNEGRLNDLLGIKK